MREYEATIVIKPDLDDEARNALIDRVAGWLTPDDDNANKPVINHWGRRSLAYPIRDYREGYYVLYEARMEPAAINAVEREILYLEDILRHLVVVKESNQNKED